MFSHAKWCVLLTAALLAGCSAMQFTYNKAGTLLGWRADSYFDFDPQQKHEFQQKITALLAWHRREQLPDYAQFTYAAVARARDGLTRDDIVWFMDGLKKRYRLIVDRGAPDAVDILATLGVEQLRAVGKEFAKDNRKFIDEHDLDCNQDRQKRARLKRMLSQITDWTGGLSRAQEQRVEQLVESIPLFEHLRHQDRMRRQAEFHELLRLRTQRQEFQTRLHAWLHDWEKGRTPEYERIATEVFERRIEFFIALEKILTPAQREHALKRLYGFGDDFKALSERPLAAAAAGVIAAF